MHSREIISIIANHLDHAAPWILNKVWLVLFNGGNVNTRGTYIPQKLKKFITKTTVPSGALSRGKFESRRDV